MSGSGNQLKIVAFIGSIREGRMAERVTALVKSVYGSQTDGHTLEIIDPEELNLPVLKKPLHFYRDPSEAPAILHKTNKKIMEADAYVIITAEYNRSIPPALKNTLDHFPPTSFAFKPSALISYSMGNTGGIVAAESLRPHLSELGCLPISHMVNISTVHKEINGEGATENAHISSSITKSYKQLVWWANACKNARADGIPK